MHVQTSVKETKQTALLLRHFKQTHQTAFL